MRGKFTFLLALGLIWTGGLLAKAKDVQMKDTQVAESHSEIVFLAEIRGSINPASADYLKRAITIASQENAQFLLVEMDTPGGLVASTRTMAQAIDESSVPVVFFVTPAGASATSAGALLMLASHVAAMSDGANIGSAQPVSTEGKEVEGKMGEKVVNDVAAFARGLAEHRHRPTQLAEEIVTKSLNLTAKEAFEKKVIEVVAADRKSLLDALHNRVVEVKGQKRRIKTDAVSVRSVEMTLGQKVLHLLANPNIAAILMSLAMLLIYVEVSNPGLGIAGILGAICLLLAFMSFQVLPIHLGGALLLLLGAGLMVAEVFAPTGGVLAGGGLLSFILGLIWVVDADQTTLRIDRSLIAGIGLSMGLVVALIVWAVSHRGEGLKKIISKVGGSQLSGLISHQGHVITVEADGRSGKARFRGEYWDFESPIAVKKGDTLKAVKVEGMKVYVEVIPS